MVFVPKVKISLVQTTSRKVSMSEKYRGENFSLRDSLQRAEMLLGDQDDKKDLLHQLAERNKEKGDVDQILSELERQLEGTNDRYERVKIINDWKQNYFSSEHR